MALAIWLVAVYGATIGRLAPPGGLADLLAESVSYRRRLMDVGFDSGPNAIWPFDLVDSAQ